ncbi:Apolipoprotein Eb [Liparis tanakae]|uniref:Apolipoprotein Eb n=1 Tax=Liparis tanakae TaxID=230148 RepID=A0A4Z2E966_9TELE|nr:Apolipoprotein Eb [Liparis tanakae]
MEDAKTRLDPYFARVRDNAWDKMVKLGELIKAQAENVKDKIETAAEDVKDHMEKTAEDLGSTLKNWFQPLVAKTPGRPSSAQPHPQDTTPCSSPPHTRGPPESPWGGNPDNNHTEAGAEHGGGDPAGVRAFTVLLGQDGEVQAVQALSAAD